MAPPDSFDADLSALHTHVDNLGPWLAIWEARVEPDADARRCASDAVDAIDAAFGELHGIRASLVTQIRRADDEAAVRADALLARMRDGPAAEAAGPSRHAVSPPPPSDKGSVDNPASREESSVSTIDPRGGDPR